MPYDPGSFVGDVRVVHGRSAENLRRFERRVNACNVSRGYLPGLGCFPVHPRATVAGLAGQMARAFAFIGLLAFKRFTAALRRSAGGAWRMAGSGRSHETLADKAPLSTLEG